MPHSQLPLAQLCLTLYDPFSSFAFLCCFVSTACLDYVKRRQRHRHQVPGVLIAQRQLVCGAVKKRNRRSFERVVRGPRNCQWKVVEFCGGCDSITRCAPNSVQVWRRASCLSIWLFWQLCAGDGVCVCFSVATSQVTFFVLWRARALSLWKNTNQAPVAGFGIGVG